MSSKKNKNQKFATHHAYVRAIERYGSISKRCCKSICTNIQNGRHVVQLRIMGDRIRYACFDQNKWYIVLYCTVDDRIATVYRLEDLSHHEKMILQNSPIYHKIGVDTFGILNKTIIRKPLCVGCTDENWGVKLNLSR